MKKIILFFYIFAAGSLSAQNKDYPIQGIPFTQVKLADKFWLPRVKTNQTVTIPASFARCEFRNRRLILI